MQRYQFVCNSQLDFVISKKKTRRKDAATFGTAGQPTINVEEARAVTPNLSMHKGTDNSVNSQIFTGKLYGRVAFCTFTIKIEKRKYHNTATLPTPRIRLMARRMSSRIEVSSTETCRVADLHRFTSF